MNTPDPTHISVSTEDETAYTPRRRIRKSQWQELIRRQEQSGLTINAFCRREQLNAATFYNWKKRLRDESDGRLVRLHPASDTNRPWSGILSHAVEAVLPNGTCLRIHIDQLEHLLYLLTNRDAC